MLPSGAGMLVMGNRLVLPCMFPVATAAGATVLLKKKIPG